jgi:hypothetical protein
MVRTRRILPSLASLAVAGAALCATAVPAMADSFYFSYGHAPPRWQHFHPRHQHYYVWGPPVVFAVPPPPVVYGPPPVVYAPPPPTAPMSVTPTSEPYRTSDGRYCREYQSTVMVNRQPQPSYGMACQMPDGTWHIMN